MKSVVFMRVLVGLGVAGGLTGSCADGGRLSRGGVGDVAMSDGGELGRSVLLWVADV